MLVAFPIALLALTPVWDALALAGVMKDARTTAYYSEAAGLLAAGLAAIAGFADLIKIPQSETANAKAALIHAGLALTMVSLFGIAFALRGGAAGSPGALVLGLEVAGALKKRDGGPAMLFTAVQGHDVPVVGNLLCCQANCEAAFGVGFVIGPAVGNLAGIAAALAASPYRLRLRYDRAVARRYLRFSGPVFVALVAALARRRRRVLLGLEIVAFGLARRPQLAAREPLHGDVGVLALQLDNGGLQLLALARAEGRRLVVDQDRPVGVARRHPAILTLTLDSDPDDQCAACAATM